MGTTLSFKISTMVEAVASEARLELTMCVNPSTEMA